MEDHSEEIKGLASFLSMLTDYYYETPNTIKANEVKLAQVEAVQKARNEARIKASVKRFEDKLRKQEKDAAEAGKERKRKRGSV